MFLTITPPRWSWAVMRYLLVGEHCTVTRIDSLLNGFERPCFATSREFRRGWKFVCWNKTPQSSQSLADKWRGIEAPLLVYIKILANILIRNVNYL